MKRILGWMLSFNPLGPLMSVAVGVMLMGGNISYEVVIP